MAKLKELQDKATELGIALKDEDGKNLTIAKLEEAIKLEESKKIGTGDKSKEETSGENTDENKDNLEDKDENDTSDNKSEEEEEEEEPDVYPSYHNPNTYQAAQIESIIRKGSGATLNLGEDFKSVEVDAAFINKYKPRAGGYFLTCEEGCKKYRTKKAFEENYVQVEEE